LNSIDLWIFAATAAAALYLLTALAVLIGRARSDSIQRAIDYLTDILERNTGVMPNASLRRVLAAQYLSSLSRRKLERLVNEQTVPRRVSEVVARHLLDRLGTKRVQLDAKDPRGRLSRWTRITALRLLALGHPDAAWEAIEKALTDSDPYVVGTAVTILGNMPKPRAAELLVKALRMDYFSASRISTFLDHFPLDLSKFYKPLLRHPRSSLRYWGAILLRRYHGVEGCVEALESLTRDQTPMVRRAAVESLSLLGGGRATQAARRLLSDEVGFVRAHAARALGALGQLESAPEIAALLADREWWVRHSAKVSLEALGPDVEAHLVPLLSHPDAFARNGAAEVLQNLGVLDRLLLDEATGTSHPSRRETLEKLVQAGGEFMWEAAVDRMPPEARERALSILVSTSVASERVMS